MLYFFKVWVITRQKVKVKVAQSSLTVTLNSPGQNTGVGSLRSSWSEPQAALSLFLADYIELLLLRSCLLRNLYTGQKATVRTRHRKTDWFQIGKGVRQGCILSPCLFNLYAEYIMRNAGLEKHKLESRLLGEISLTSDMQMTPPLWQKVMRN